MQSSLWSMRPLSKLAHPHKLPMVMRNSPYCASIVDIIYYVLCVHQLSREVCKAHKTCVIDFERVQPISNCSLQRDLGISLSGDTRDVQIRQSIRPALDEQCDLFPGDAGHGHVLVDAPRMSSSDNIAQMASKDSKPDNSARTRQCTNPKKQPCIENVPAHDPYT